MGQAKAPDGYEIVPKDEYRKHKGDESLLLWSERVSRWHKREFPHLALFSTDIYARPIRKRTLWVPASERQPPFGVPVHWRRVGVRCMDLGPADTRNEHSVWDNDIEWLDLDAAEAIEAERDRLAAQYAEHAARIAELEAELADAKLDRAAELTAENDLLRRERDALVDGLCRQGEWFRGMVRGLIGAREVN